jgi:hypothetical protein
MAQNNDEKTNTDNIKHVEDFCNYVERQITEKISGLESVEEGKNTHVIEQFNAIKGVYSNILTQLASNSSSEQNPDDSKKSVQDII